MRESFPPLPLRKAQGFVRAYLYSTSKALPCSFDDVQPGQDRPGTAGWFTLAAGLESNCAPQPKPSGYLTHDKPEMLLTSVLMDHTNMTIFEAFSTLKQRVPLEGSFYDS